MSRTRVRRGQAQGDIEFALPPKQAEFDARLREVLKQFETIGERINDHLKTPHGAGWMRLYRMLKRAQADPVIAASPPAAEFLAVMLELASDALTARTAEDALMPLDGMLPKGELGAKFITGRKPGTVSPLRKAVRRILQRKPKATAAEVWATLSDNPPKGVAFFDNPQGKYVETDGQKDTGWGRFQTICSEERKPQK